MTDTTRFECHEKLKNGLEVTVRDLRADDRDAMARAVRQLDPESIYTRLFSYRKFTETGLDRIMKVDPEHEVALVVTLGAPPDHTVIGGCRLVELGAGEQGRRSAEVAFTIEEDYQGQGLASRLLGHLIAIARSRGLHTLEADVLARNPAMLRVFERCGLPMRRRPEGASVHLMLDLGGAAST